MRTVERDAWCERDGGRTSAHGWGSRPSKTARCSVSRCSKHTHTFPVLDTGTRGSHSTIDASASGPINAVNPAGVAANGPVAPALTLPPVDATVDVNGVGVGAVRRTEFVFIDRSVAGFEDLISDLNHKQQADIHFEVHHVDGNSDGVEQIARVLEGRTGIDALHVISHGGVGHLFLGDATLDRRSIGGGHAAALATIKGAMARGGDLLLYGCDAAAGDSGRAFVSALAAATGHAALGGDWTFEGIAGVVETPIPWSPSERADFHGLLNVTAGTGDGHVLISIASNIYSADVLTGKATLVTTIPATVGGVAFTAPANSLAVNRTDGLIYYASSAAANTNRALFAYDYINNTHILIDDDLTNNGAGASIAVGAGGLSSGGAEYHAGTLYLGVENVTATTDVIYRLTLRSPCRSPTAR